MCLDVLVVVLRGGATTSSSVDSNSSLSVKVVVPFYVYCSSAGMCVVVHSSLICDTSSVCVLMVCVFRYGSSVDVGGCPIHLVPLLSQ